MSASFDIDAFAAAFAAGVVDASSAWDLRRVGDLYATLEKSIDEASRALPPFACRKGCTACCYSPLTITALEWRFLHAHLLELDENEWERIVDAAELVRPLLPELVKQHREGIGAILQMQCPFLIDGACSVYAARPLICRAFGKTFIDKGIGAPPGDDEPRLFASVLAHAHIERSFPPKFRLPLASTYIDRMRSMTHEAKGALAPLPLWLFAHLDGRRLAPKADLAPDFSRL